MRHFKRTSLFDQIMDAVLGHIRDNKMKPGDRMPSEEEIAQTLGVGRNSVREVLKALQAMGFIEVRRGEGTFLKAFDFGSTLSRLSIGMMIEGGELSDLLRLRYALEKGFVGDVCTKMTEEKLQELRRISHRIIESVDDPARYYELDAAFHRELYSVAGCSLLDRLQDAFWGMFEGYMYQAYISDSLMLRHFADQHDRILDSVEQGDVREMSRLLDDHFADKEQMLKKITSERNHNEVS